MRKHKRDRFKHTKTEHEAPKQKYHRSKEKRLYRTRDLFEWGDAFDDDKTQPN